MPATDNQNQNPNNRNTVPPEIDFQQSETYRVIHQVGDKVVQGINQASGKVVQELNQAGVTGDKVARGINEAARELNRAVDAVSRNFSAYTNQNRTYRPPAQNGSQTYSYTHTGNPNGRTQQNGQPNPASSGGYAYVPPANRQYAQPNPPRTPYTQPQPAPNPHRTVKPVPPPAKPGMIEKRRPSNAKFWFVGIMCALYALNMPMYRWIDLAALAAVGVGAFFLGRLIFRGKKYYVPAEEPKKPEPVKKEEPVKKSATGNPEVDKIIDEGQEYLKQLREANDRIPDAVMSERISRMEVASADIFAYIAEHPDKAPQIRRFMNYYLPTTLKLLTSYDKLSRQRVKGENIQKTMFEIEGMMETIAGAFEKQLDSLFGDDAMDIAADISVMESILKQEGLSDDESLKMPKVKTAAAGGKAAQQVETPVGIPTLTLDPDAADGQEE
ncbi:MAG: 5-bromo-4-chloroindolyl phosphate hydrolysis family protein [Hominenteromicrobium sp.]